MWDGYKTILFISLLIMQAALSMAVHAQPEFAEEYQIKAGYLRHLGKFIQWPADVFPRDDSPLVLCLLGDSPFSNDIVKALNNKRVRQRQLQVVQMQTISQRSEQCHILFVSRSEEGRLAAILDWVESRPILSVSDINNFARRKGMIEMSIKEQKIALIIHLPSIKSSNLIVNPQLLSLSTIIQDSE